MRRYAPPGDAPFVLVAMNPAALKVNLPDLQPGGIIIVNEDEFTADNLAKADTRPTRLPGASSPRSASSPWP